SCDQAKLPDPTTGCDEYTGTPAAVVDADPTRCNESATEGGKPRSIPEDCERAAAHNADLEGKVAEWNTANCKASDDGVLREIHTDCDGSTDHNARVAEVAAGNNPDAGQTGYQGPKTAMSSASIKVIQPSVITTDPDANDGDLMTSGIMVGTDKFVKCQKSATSSFKWSDIVKSKHNSRKLSAYTKAWQELFKVHRDAVESAGKDKLDSLNSLRTEVEGDQGSQFMQQVGPLITTALKEGGSLFNKLSGCVGIASVTTNKENYQDEELKRAVDNMTKKSIDGKIKCKAAGAETQDWDACKTLVTTYDAAAVGQVVVQEGQKLSYMDKELEGQTELMADGGKDPTKALEVQEGMVRKQADIANQRAAFHGAKLAALLAAQQAMPTAESVESQCTGNNDVKKSIELLQIQYHAYTTAFLQFASNTVGNKLKASFKTGSTPNESGSEMIVLAPVNFKESYPADAQAGETIDVASLITKLDANGDGFPEDSSEQESWVASEGANDANSAMNNVCANAMYDGTNIIMNSEAIEQATAAMVQAGVDMAANVAKGQILANQADRIGDVADGIKKFEPSELPMFAEEDAEVTACQADPMSTECLEIDNRRGVGYGGNSISFGGANRATSGPGAELDGDSTSSNAKDGSKTDRSKVASKIGRSIAGVNKGGGLDGIAGKAGVKAGGNPAAGGGGGGGAGGASAPGNGGARGGGGGVGGRKGALSAKKVRYRGGSLSFGGSGKGGRSKAKKSGNPFAKLLGKKGGKKGGTMKFRNPASIGSKKGSLFQMISNRYTVISKKKQLLEYENAKN
ncbi:MAG: hypothetical protein KC493_14385, partial [Bacteriovoracaceae bacterium]|nr:hypothetical protein [Bacteriovoracaceae bacterium]